MQNIDRKQITKKLIALHKECYVVVYQSFLSLFLFLRNKFVQSPNQIENSKFHSPKEAEKFHFQTLLPNLGSNIIQNLFGYGCWRKTEFFIKNAGRSGVAEMI